MQPSTSFSPHFSLHQSLSWDIFCTVVDNYGDIGVCWRLASNLAQRGQRVRLWVDDPAPLQWMAPQGCRGVQVYRWQSPMHDHDWPVKPTDVLIEAFGCTLDDAVQRHWAQQHAQRPCGLWINLEYLTAENYASACHLLPSPVMHGPARGLSKLFFYPGFTADTGGLLREPDLLQRQHHHARQTTLESLGAQADPDCLTVSLFCYQPPALPRLLEQLAQQPSQLLMTQGLAHSAVQQAMRQKPLAHAGTQCEHISLPWLTQRDFDALLWSCSLNFVRGEDSLVRALWAGKPFVWQIYPQHDNAHHAKLHAFLDWLQAPQDLRDWHGIWNGLHDGTLPQLNTTRLQHWQACVQAARERLLLQTDLCSQLLKLVDSQYSADAQGMLVPTPASGHAGR